MAEPLVSVIVVNYNGGRYLARCIGCLQRQTFQDFEAIIVDNGSKDGSFDDTRKSVQDSRVRFIALGRNVGFAAGNNSAAAQARGKWLALLNPDAFPEPDWLMELIEATKRHPDVGMFGSTQIDANDPTLLDGAGDHYFAAGLPWRGGHRYPISNLPPEHEAFGPCAAAAMYRTTLFRRLGGFDEHFFCYCEDVDLAFRARLVGDPCIQVPGGRVHPVGGAIAGARSSFACYHGARNLIWTFVKNMPSPLFWILLPLHVAVVSALVIVALFRGDGVAVGRGVRDAVVDLPRVLEARRRVQADRTADLTSIGQAMSWNIWYRLRRMPL